MKGFVVLKNQWHAQPVAQPPEAAGADADGDAAALSVLAAGAAASVLAAEDAGVAEGAEVPPEPPLKSVAYQPEPLS